MAKKQTHQDDKLSARAACSNNLENEMEESDGMEGAAIFAVSNKGGVGKSTVVMRIADYLRFVLKEQTLCYDLDPVGTSSTRYGFKNEQGIYDVLANKANPYDGFNRIDVRLNAEHVGDTLNRKARWRLYDFPGGYTDPAPIFGDADALIEEFALVKSKVVVVYVINDDEEPAAGIVETMKQWGPKVKFVIVKNLNFSEENEFNFFEGDFAEAIGAPGRVARENGAIVTSLPKLDGPSRQTLQALKMPTTLAIDELERQRNNPDAPQAFRTRLRRIQKFLADSEPMLKAIGVMK